MPESEPHEKNKRILFLNIISLIALALAVFLVLELTGAINVIG